MLHFKGLAKQLAKRVLETPVYANLLYAHDRAAVAVGYRLCRPAKDGVRRHLLIAPEGNGNLGDQAMLNAIVARTDGPLCVVTLSPDSLTIPARQALECKALPRAIRGAPLVRVPDVIRFGRELRSASALSMPGADTLDGANPHYSLTRLNLVRAARSYGVPATIQGFSWSDDAPATLARALRRTGAKLVPRDPRSRSRLLGLGVVASEGADVVFSYAETAPLPAELEKVLVSAEMRNRKVALFNTSGLIHRKQDLIEDYCNLVNHLQGLGYTVVFVPHVIRASDDDRALAREIYRRVGAKDDFLIDVLLTPEQVKSLVSRASICMTGRMHLAVQSLNHCLPVATLATAGKVEGLYDLFGLPELVLQPRPGFSAEAALLLDEMDRSTEKMSCAISAALPHVRELALKNFVQDVA